MPVTTLIPTTSVDPNNGWDNHPGALTIDNVGASCTGPGFLILSEFANRDLLPVGNIVTGFEVELYARTNGQFLVIDSLTDTVGKHLHQHNGELNADWKHVFTVYQPSYQTFNAAGRTYYAATGPGGATTNGAEHFLTSYTPPSADYASEAVIYAATDAGSGEKAEIYTRADPAANAWYFLQYDEGVNTWYLGVQNGAGTRTNLGSYVGDPIFAGTSRTARLESRGTSHKAFIDGVERISVTNNVITAANCPGLKLEAATSRLSVGSAVVTAAWDLGSAQTVTRIRRRFGWINSNAATQYIEASNDGVTWVNANTGGLPPINIPTGSFQWESEWDTSNITSTAYRYWRVYNVDNGASVDCRIGDFRVYVGGVLQTVGGSVTARFGFRTGTTPHNWAEMSSTALFSDNSPGDTSTWIGGTPTVNLANEGLQFESFRVERLVPTTLNVYLSNNAATPTGTVKTLTLTGTNTYRLVGGPADLFGGAWSIGDVQSNGFSLLLERSETNAVPWVDYAQVKVNHVQNGGTMSLRENVRQSILIGRETTVGTAVATNIRLRHARIQPQPAVEFRDYRPAGEKLINHQVILKESSEGPIEGIPTYDEMGYLLQGLISRPSTTILQASTAFRHVFSFDNRQRDPISTYTAQYGDVFSRAHQIAGMIINSLDLALRQDGMDLGGSVIGRELSDGVTMTNGAATVQTLTQSGTGTYALRFRGQETAALTAGAALTSANIETALRALPYINASTQLTVSGSVGGPFTITFGNLTAGPFKGFPQPLLEVRTLSGTPTTAVAMTTKGGYTELPGQIILPRHVEFYMTPTLASIGTAKISEAFVTGFSMANRAAPVYNLDRTSTSWFAYAEPSNIDVNFSLIAHANSNGMSFLPQGRSDTILYLRIVCTGPLIGATAFPHRLQIDCPVKVSNFGPFSENQDVYAFEYGLTAAQDETTNNSLVITLDNGVANYD